MRITGDDVAADRGLDALELWGVGPSQKMADDGEEFECRQQTEIGLPGQLKAFLIKPGGAHLWRLATISVADQDALDTDIGLLPVDDIYELDQP